MVTPSSPLKIVVNAEVPHSPKANFQIQSEASEVAYRDVKVRSIKKIPTAITKAANL
jgi:hypothetical protein